MAANQFERHRAARKRIKAVFENPDKVSAVHYSCESFYDLPDGRSPRITSVAIRNLKTGQTESFSIHQAAELRGIPMNKDSIEPFYNELEKEMLDKLASSLQNRSSQTFIHWNMRDANYGFQAIEHRHKVLSGSPCIVADDKKEDLSRLFIELYGVGYIEHPRLEKLLALNAISARDFMTGKQEADAFVDGKYVDLHRSTLRKVDVLCNIATRAYDEKLRTRSSWKESHGISKETVAFLIKRHWLVSSIALLGTVGGAIAGIIKFIASVW